MRYLLKYGAALILMATALSSCREEPNYPDEPEIEFKRVDVSYKKEFGVTTANLTIVIGFQDGKGNLGLRPLDNNPNTSDPDSRPPFNAGSQYQNNFITEMFIKKPVQGSPSDSAFVKFQFPVQGFDFSGRFRRLNNDERVEPLEGEIKYTINSITDEFFKPGDIIKFQIFIYDRNTPIPHKSNTVETRPIKLTFKT